MKTISSGFKENIKNFGRELDSIITYDIEGQEYELRNADLNSVTPHYEGNILKSVMKQLDIDSNVDIPVGALLNCQFGIKVNDDYEYIDFGNYIVYSSEAQEDTKSYKIICYDKMLYSMKEYEPLDVTYSVSIRNYIIALCDRMGITFKNRNEEFANYNRMIQTDLYAGLGYTYRDVLDDLAEVTASTICISNNDELEIRYITETNDSINEEYLKDVNVNFGEYYGPINSVVLSRSAESDNVYIKNDESIAENGITEIKIKDNQIMNFNDRADYLPDIYAKIGGLQFYINDFSSTGICYYELCDRYTVNIEGNSYSCVMFNDDINVTQGLEESVYTEKPETSETDYTKADKTDQRINQTYLIVDKQNQVIESVVSNVSEQDNKISQITQTVDDLSSKISDIADITITGESNYATFTLDNINESEPIMIKVKPISESISYLYPRSNLYPSNDLYSKNRKIRFENLTTHEVKDYELPMDLLYYDSNTYDEFYLDYESQTCQTIKRCGYNADGSVYVLSEEQTYNHTPYPTIQLSDGDYRLTLLGYEYGYLFVRLMAKNIYTSQFYTKVETNSKIEQSATNINLSVDSKLTNYSTTAEMNTAINLSADNINSVVSTKVGNNEVISKINQSSEAITINANKLNLQGYITASDLSGSGTTTINGSNITTGTISANRVSGGTLTGTTISGNTITGGTLSGTSINVTTGTIGGWNINSASITAANGNYLAYIGNISNTNKDFLFVRTGTSDNYQYPFVVRGDGFMQATNANITGTITTTAGNIGGWTITSNDLYNTRSGMSSNTGKFAFWAGETNSAHGSSSTNASFKVAHNGDLVATNANISGTINATSGSFSGSIYSSYGKIGGWNISNDQLYGTASTGVKWAIRPFGVSNQSIGMDYYWGNIVSNASDKKLKNNIEDIDEKYDEFYDNLKPKTFFYNKDVADDKKHIGFIAQDILESEKEINEDLSMVYKNPQDYYFLDREEIIALNTWQIQKLKERLNKQEEEIALLKEEIKLLKEKI